MSKGHGIPTDDAAITYADGQWHQGNPPMLGPRDHAVWLSSVVFDGARAIQGRVPDLDLHCARAVRSAQLLGLAPSVTADDIEALAREAVAKFPADAELYICPMFYAKSGFIVPDAASTQFVLSVYPSALPAPDGFSACVSSYRRPARDMAPTEAKASCLYPNVARCVREATERGFDTAVVRDPNGNVAEFAYTNLFFAKGGQVTTPAINGTFLNGITRQRVIQLLRDDGVDVVERAVSVDELKDADEVFATGNYAKVYPCTRLEDRTLAPGPFHDKARALYFAYADTQTL